MASHMFMVFADTIETDTTAKLDSSATIAIEILSWSHGFSQPTSPTRSGAGAGTVEQAHHSNLSFTKYLDGSTASLLKTCWSGKMLGTVTLQCFRASGETANPHLKYLEVEMKNVIIGNYNVSGGGGDIPVENLSLDYGVVKYTYMDQKDADGTGDGAKPATHNLITRTIE